MQVKFNFGALAIAKIKVNNIKGDPASLFARFTGIAILIDAGLFNTDGGLDDLVITFKSIKKL